MLNKELIWFPSKEDMLAQDEAFEEFYEKYKDSVLIQNMEGVEYEKYLFYCGFFRGCEFKERENVSTNN